MRVLVRSSGFKSAYRTELDEIRCGHAKKIGGNPDCNWSPSNPDMEVLANRSGGGQPAANLNELAALIERQPAGSIDELRILGHSSSRFFALGGEMLPNDPSALVRFSEPAMIGLSASFLTMRPRFQRMRDRFAAKGRITLAGCGSGGTNLELLDLVSSAFMVCVSGFQRPIQYGLIISRSSLTIGPGWKIKERGRVSYSAATLLIEERLNDEAVDISAFPTNAWVLEPDAESCAGQFILDTAARSNTSSDPMGAATAVGWAMLKQFYRDKIPLFAGVKGDESLRGLRLEVQGPRLMLVVGIPFARATNPQTIDQRMREMGELMEFVSARQPGTVQMK
jgi:hypothetical protein